MAKKIFLSAAAAAFFGEELQTYTHTKTLETFFEILVFNNFRLWLILFIIKAGKNS